MISIAKDINFNISCQIREKRTKNILNGRSLPHCNQCPTSSGHLGIAYGTSGTWKWRQPSQHNNKLSSPFMYKHKIHHFPYFCCLKPLSSRSWWLGCWNGGNDLGMEPTGGLPPERNPCGETLNFEDLGLKRQIYMSIRQRNCTKKNPYKLLPGHSKWYSCH